MNHVESPIQLNNGKVIINNSYAGIVEVVMVLLSFFTIMTPRDALGLKKIFLGLALLLGLFSIIKGVGKNGKLLFFSTVLPIIMYCVSVLDTGSATSAISYLYPFVYLLLLFPVLEYNINVRNIALSVGNMMIFIILASCILDAVGILSVYNNPLLSWLNSNGEAQISKSGYAMFRYVLFFKASPILFFNLTHYIKEKMELYAVLTFVALLFTGTRANIYLAAALLVVGLLFMNNNSILKVVTILAIVLVILFFGVELINRYHLITFAKAKGDTIRSAGFSSIIEVMNSHKSYWLTGMGFGSTYYNAGRLTMVETSELSYLEFIREIGIPLSLIEFYFLVTPLIKLKSIDIYFLLAYGAFLAAGIVDPFVFTSTGMFIIMMAYSEMYKAGNCRPNS